jgi:hypothetical protein
VNFSLIGSILAWGSAGTAFSWDLVPLVVYPFLFRPAEIPHLDLQAS